ncbi:hypothetical protein D025_1343 [Vibrio parahaemolyticus 949]|nr:conserved hypothetical protein [Vibrio parahaemolyticus AN-5034]EQL90968.1 hypothetical protein D035_4745 [Vibrio parahaemolyticus VP250]EQL91928.1 hypothetical protein D036_3550 [Vibrio parahaemolyticus VP232]EQM46289.1 hypothetical protein D025_1343 [Vibrio parahaemolyticus 949]ETS22622.1 hypothetical protein D033_1751 [Vibrio parahaemolyticus B-265]ETX25558.1 hypothetical protein D037_0827 [Vibrio parahaemolyticus IDH02640]ETX58895.1 hypothetical protein D038_0751 [Vibrio parahaemolytic
MSISTKVDLLKILNEIDYQLQVRIVFIFMVIKCAIKPWCKLNHLKLNK